MSKLVSKVKEEIRKILPPTIFFFVTLHMIALIRSLMLKGTGIPVASSVTVAALTLGKAVLIVDAFPFVNRYPDKPLAYNVAWKTVIYSVAATFIHYLENLYDFWKETGGLAAGNEKLLANIVWAHYWATEILLVAILLCIARDQVGPIPIPHRRIGEGVKYQVTRTGFWVSGFGFQVSGFSRGRGGYRGVSEREKWQGFGFLVRMRDSRYLEHASASGADAHWFHELLEKDLSGMDRVEQFLARHKSS